MRLENRSEESHFVAHYTMPIASLLEDAVIPPPLAFDAATRNVLREFLNELRSGLGPVSRNVTVSIVSSGEKQGRRRSRS